MLEKGISEIKGCSISLVIKTELKSWLWRKCYFLLRQLMIVQSFIGNAIFKI